MRLDCPRVGGSGRGRWRVAGGGWDSSLSRRARLDLLLRWDGARGAGGGHSLGGVVGAGAIREPWGAMHVSWCYQNGYVWVLYQGDWGTCETVVCLVGRVMLVS